MKAEGERVLNLSRQTIIITRHTIENFMKEHGTEYLTYFPLMKHAYTNYYKQHLRFTAIMLQ